MPALLKDDLNHLGLTDGEAKVYLSLLKLGSAKVGAIVRDSVFLIQKFMMCYSG
jgi:sugar-specific transcriptional regulator TrmB